MAPLVPGLTMFAFGCALIGVAVVGAGILFVKSEFNHKFFRPW